MIHKLLKVQADIKTEILKKTGDEDLSHYLAADIMHIVLTSDIVLGSAKITYKNLK